MTTPTVPGNCGRDEENDCWRTQKAPSEWRWRTWCEWRRQATDPTTSLGTQELSQACEGTLLMWQRTICSASTLTDFSSLWPSSILCGAILKPRRSQSFLSKCHSNFKKNTENFIEVEKRNPTSRSDSFEMSHLFEPVKYMIFGTMWRYPTHVYEPLLEPGRDPLLMLDMPVFSDCGNIESTLREEPPDTVIFYETLVTLATQMTLSETGPAYERRRSPPSSLT